MKERTLRGVSEQRDDTRDSCPLPLGFGPSSFSSLFLFVPLHRADTVMDGSLHPHDVQESCVDAVPTVDRTHTENSPRRPEPRRPQTTLE